MLFYRLNDKSKLQDKKVLAQGLKLPNPAMTTTKAPAALPKPSVLPAGDTQPFAFHEPQSSVGLAKVKNRQNTPAYMKILPNPAIIYQFVTGPGNTAVLVPSSPPPASTPSTNLKRKAEEVRTEAKKQKRCSKCGEEMTPPAHQQYMGYRYCSSVDKTPYTEWRENLNQAGVARKKKFN